MKHLFLSLVCLISTVFMSCGQMSDPLRNKIDFPDNINQVSDSIKLMESLFKKIPQHERINYFIDSEGNLYVNNKKLGALNEAFNNSSIRDDSVFLDFSDMEYQKFISIIVFLLKNNIDASVKDNTSGFFAFEYRKTPEYTYNDLRDIIIDVDTTAPLFVKRFQILDRKGNMILVAPIDVKIK